MKLQPNDGGFPIYLPEEVVVVQVVEAMAEQMYVLVLPKPQSATQEAAQSWLAQAVTHLELLKNPQMRLNLGKVS